MSAAAEVKEVAGKRISSEKFYGNYYGHRKEHFEVLLEAFKGTQKVWLAGDSSLDNKHWLLKDEKKPAVNGYEMFLEPAESVQDVAYWLNANESLQKAGYVAVNAALEESTIAMRLGDALTEPDEVIRNNVGSQDIIIVSIGGNDIGLKLTADTRAQLMILMGTNSIEQIICATAETPGVAYFIKMFRKDVTHYLSKLCSVQKPRTIVPCMIYFPDEHSDGGGTWAGPALRMLGYDQDPGKLQSAIYKLFELATSNITIEGVTIVPFPLFQILDGKTTSDYVSRVEPSVTGGEKIANALCKQLFN